MSGIFEKPIVHFEDNVSQKQEPIFLGIQLGPKKITLETKLYEQNFQEITSEDIKKIEASIRKKNSNK